MGQRYSIERIQSELKATKPYLSLVSKKYQHCYQDLQWYCGVCKNTFKRCWATIKIVDTGCPFCAPCQKYNLKTITGFLTKHQKLAHNAVPKNRVSKWRGL